MSYQIIAGNDQGLADVGQFIEMLQRLDQHPMPEVRSLFDSGAELIVTRAPGRLDVMGGFADYSGALVLQLPLQAATLAALQRDSERHIRIVSLGAVGNL